MKTPKLSQEGFTLIELIVVIVILGILAALAIPKMLNMTVKTKMNEVPTIIANWEALESAYTQEKGDVGAFAAIGFVDPSYTAPGNGSSKWWDYTVALTVGSKAVMSAENTPTVIGNCPAATVGAYVSTYSIATDKSTHSGVLACTSYTPNF